MSNIQFEDYTTKDGIINTRIILDSKKVSLHSVQPYKEAERILAHFNPDLKWIVIAGCGMAYILETILEKTSFNIIAFEHSNEIIEHAVKLRNNGDIYTSERVCLFHDPDDMLEFMDQQSIKEVSFYIHRPYLTLFPELYQNLEGILISYLSKKQINKATLIRFQYIWLRNLIKNSSYFFELPGLSDLKHGFDNKPAIVVGAGPSLQEDLAILASCQDKVCIIATDTAYPILCEQNIKSDFVVSVDPQNKNTQFLLYASSKDTCLVLDATGSFLSFAKSGMRDIVYYDSFFSIYESISSFWGGRGQLLSGGSVSTNAYDLACQLGCSPIIFSGQDLAFTDSHTHSRGNILEDFLYSQVDRLESFEKYNTKLLVLSDRIQVKANDGKSATTDRKFLTYLEWFKKQIRESSSPVYNTSEKGAQIKGAQYKSLLQISKEDFHESLDKSLSFTHRKLEQKSYLNYLDELLKSIDRLIPYAVKAYHAARNCLISREKELQKSFNIMSTFDQELLTTLKTGAQTARFLELCMQSSIEKMAELSTIKTINEDLINGWIALYGEAQKGLRYIKRLIQKRKQITS